MAIASINPATGEKLKEFAAFDDKEIEKRLKRAEQAFAHHRREPFPKRAQLMVAAASLLEQEKEKLARIITLEMGKLLSGAMEEVEKCVRGCRFYAENAERFLEDEPAQTGRGAKLRRLSTDGSGARDHAVEFSILAGLSFCRACVNGGKCRAAQTCGQRAAVRACD